MHILRGKAEGPMWERKSTSFAEMTGFHRVFSLNGGTSEKGNPALAQAIAASVKHARDYLTRELGWDFIRANGKKSYKMKKV